MVAFRFMKYTCGISSSPTKNYLQVMNDLQRHRGPDGEGVWMHQKNFLGLSHVRLSIIDLETGQQPMQNIHDNIPFFYRNHLVSQKKVNKVSQLYQNTSLV